jgi:hypothetical protein
MFPSLPNRLAKAGWKVKVRDKERLEQPHLTIIRRARAWRVGLRDGRFLDAGRWKDFPDAIREAIERNWDRLCQEWDAMYPHNPVRGQEEATNDESG